MDNLLYIGQWQGFFQYGPEYGIGANDEISIVEGFISGSFINFTKQYSENLMIDEWGNSYTQNDGRVPKIVYEGTYDKKTNTFIGTWEILYK